MRVDPPRILAVLPGFIPSTMITIVKPLVNLHRAGSIRARIVLEQQAGLADIEGADAIVFCRNADPRHASLLAAARARGTPLIYDLDDNLFELPPKCEDRSGIREAPQQAMLEEYLRSAALVRVYSRPLAERVAVLNPRVARTFAPVDMSLVPPLRETRPPGPIKIAYATSRTQDALCAIFWPALERILSRYADRVEVHFWGCRPPQSASGRCAGPCNVRHHGLICQYDRYLRRFSGAGYDIGLAPLPDDIFYRSKTNNKFREYGASGIAGIYSQNDVYSDCVRHEVTGLLVANDASAWYDAMERLIEDESLRMRIRRQARQYVAEHYAQEKFEQLFLEQLHEVLSRPAGQAAPVAEAAVPGRPWRETRTSCPCRVESSASGAKSAALPRRRARLGDRARRSLGTLHQLGPRQAWTALRWFVNDRCLAAWLRWQLR